MCNATYVHGICMTVSSLGVALKLKTILHYQELEYFVFNAIRFFVDVAFRIFCKSSYCITSVSM